MKEEYSEYSTVQISSATIFSSPLQHNQNPACSPAWSHGVTAPIICVGCVHLDQVFLPWSLGVPLKCLLLIISSFVTLSFGHSFYGSIAIHPTFHNNALVLGINHTCICSCDVDVCASSELLDNCKCIFMRLILW
jgi:hypothetical protein